MLALVALEEDEYLILKVRGTHRYLQFMDQGGFARRGGDVDGSPNYYRDLARPMPLEDVAVMATLTLNHVHRASHPGELEQDARSTAGMSIRFPHLIIRRRAEA